MYVNAILTTGRFTDDKRVDLNRADSIYIWVRSKISNKILDFGSEKDRRSMKKVAVSQEVASDSSREIDNSSPVAEDLPAENSKFGRQMSTIIVDGREVTPRPHPKYLAKLLGSKIRPIPEQREVCPKGGKNYLSRLTWGWIGPLLRKGYDRILEIEDAWTIPENEKNKHRMKEYREKLESYKARGGIPYQEFFAMLFALRWIFIDVIVTNCVYIGGDIGMALISRSLISSVDKVYLGNTGERGRAIGLTFGNTAVSGAFQWLFVWNGYKTRYFAELCRTMLISAVYDKVMKLSPAGRQQFPGSQITALITTDTNRIFMAARWTSTLLVFLPAFGGFLGVLIHNLGVAALPGCGLVIIGIMLNVFISRFITRLRRKSLPFADKRIATVRETVENMRVIKFYGWESSFVKLISRERTQETRFLKRLAVIEGFTDASLSSFPTFAGVLSFAIRIILGHNLSPDTAFPSLTLFQLFVPLSMMFSTALTSHSDAWTSVQRLNELFLASEEPNYVTSLPEDSKESVRIVDGTFKWDIPTPTKQEKNRSKWKKWLRLRHEHVIEEVSVMPVIREPELVVSEKDPEQPQLLRAGAKGFPGLLNLNFSASRGELVMVVGAIGSGKTTFLNAITGSVSKYHGSVGVRGIVSSVMSTWSQNDTVRNNILFGSEYDAKWYAKVVHACCLEPDFENFSERDFTEVGERGITLSGGQKARISLARCVYNLGDIVLLDDVLSAVDAKVANHIFTMCIQGLLGGKTRIISTHNLNLLPFADRIVYLPGGGEIVIGTLPELQKNPSFNDLFAKTTKNSDGTDSSGESDFDEIDEEGLKLTMIQTNEVKPQMSRPPEGQVKLMQDEQRARGTITGDILWKYFESGSVIGIAFVPIIILVVMCVAVGQAMQSVWLQFWTQERYDERSGWYIGFYCLIISLRAIFFIVMAVSIGVFCFNSSSKLHNNAVANIYRAPMSYFDSTPLGRIINRFTDDVASLDTSLFMMLRLVLFSGSMLCASLVTVFVYVPYTALLLIPILVVGFVLLNFYRASARELKRINSLFRSNMFTVLTETIGGLTVILGFRQQENFRRRLDERIDDMNISFQVNLASQYWLALRVVATALFVNWLAIFLSAFQVFDLDASKVGLLLSMLPSVSISIVLLLPMITELENQMNSVERLHELAHSLPQEAEQFIPEAAPPKDWPFEGTVNFQKAALKYRQDLPLVLKELDLNIKGGERLGICGRTGAGKSTIVAALFRITELTSGSIEIDGIDIATIGLGDLRSKISIIPQEPVLFQGTIRSNLDPFKSHSDAELWDALRRSGVIRKDEVDDTGGALSFHKFHLEAKVDSEGSNFSLGERQLLTLARALVRHSRILVLDEATASVDLETDMMIQETIAREFKDSTVLCIAHRLETILHYDRVLVMEAGTAAELGSPYDLFKTEGSYFSSMCSEANITEADF